MTAPLVVPPQLKLAVTPAAYELIRRLLGGQPLDSVRVLVGDLEAQVNQQIVEYNALKTAEVPAGETNAWAESGVEASSR